MTFLCDAVSVLVGYSVNFRAFDILKTNCVVMWFMLMLLFLIWLLESFRRKHASAVSHACVKMFVFFFVFVM